MDPRKILDGLGGAGYKAGASGRTVRKRTGTTQAPDGIQAMSGTAQQPSAHLKGRGPIGDLDKAEASEQPVVQKESRCAVGSLVLPEHERGAGITGGL